MRAAVFYGRGDIRVEDVPPPKEPGSGELLIDVAKASICGTDAAEWGHGPVLAQPPVVLGHEFTGTVRRVGEGTQGFSEGDRVVCGAGISCGSCEWCRTNRTNLCASYQTVGLHLDGGLAESVLAPAAICLPVPDELDEAAAAMAQPLAVALHAVRRSGLAGGRTCAVIGVGGIGAFVVSAAARLSPSTLVAVDVVPARLERALQLGATTTLDASTEADIGGAIRELTGGEGAHVVIEASGAGESPAIAVAAARKGGHVVLLGLPARPAGIDLLTLTTRELDVCGTLAHVCSQDLPEAVELLASTPLARIVIDREIPLGALVEDGVKPLSVGAVEGKVVVDVRR